MHLIHSLSSPLLEPAVNQRFASLREVLNDDEHLAVLLGIKAISVRRYAKGERTCPEDAPIRAILALAQTASFGTIAS